MSQRRLRRIVFSGLDNIYAAARKVSISWRTKRIPLLTLKAILTKSKIRKPKRAIKVFAEQYNNILDQLYMACEKAAGVMESRAIPVHVLLKYIGEIKEGFTNGQDGTH